MVIFTITGISLTPLSCSGAPTIGPEELPLLGDNKIHLYAQEAFEAFPADVTQAVAARHAELVAVGMTHARHLLDWASLEPTPGNYDTQSLIDALDARLASGITHQFCNITVLDSFGAESLPPFIAELRTMGVAWGDPQITGAFANLLDAIVPIMLPRGVYLLGLSNESGGYYENEPTQASSFTNFIQAAISHVHTLAPDLACTVVFAGANDASLVELMPLLDVASFNSYAYFTESDPTCQLAGSPLDLFRASLSTSIGALLDDLIGVSQGKLICIQEFGQATGWNDMPQTLGPQAGLENQRAVIQALVDALDARRDSFRTFCLWTLNDHSQAGIQYLGDALLAEGLPPCFADNQMEIFGPTGLVHSDTMATPKPSFDEFKKAILYFSQNQAAPNLSSGGLLVLMLGLLTGGIFVLRRRER